MGGFCARHYPLLEERKNLAFSCFGLKTFILIQKRLMLSVGAGWAIYLAITAVVFTGFIFLPLTEQLGIGGKILGAFLIASIVFIFIFPYIAIAPSLVSQISYGLLAFVAFLSSLLFITWRFIQNLGRVITITI